MRSSNLIYSLDERPPALVCLVNAAQQLTIITPLLIYPILPIARNDTATKFATTGASAPTARMAIGTLLQAGPGRWTAPAS